MTTSGKISGLAREVLHDGTGQIRLSQLAREVLRDGTGQVRAAGLARESLHDGSGAVHFSRLAREVLYTTIPPVFAWDHGWPSPQAPLRLSGGYDFERAAQPDEIPLQPIPIGKQVSSIPTAPLRLSSGYTFISLTFSPYIPVSGLPPGQQLFAFAAKLVRQEIEVAGYNVALYSTTPDLIVSLIW